MKKLILLLSLIVTTSMADGQGLYKNCVGCHGESGEKKALQQSALIGGQDSNETIKELTAYKNGELNQYGLGNIMKMQLLSLNDEDIEELAEYIANMNQAILNK